MGILGRLVERRSASFSVSDDLPDHHWFIRWLGTRSDAGVQVNEHTALNTLAVVACISLLADTYASMPLILYRRLRGGGRERARQHPLYRVLHDQANPMMSAFTWKHVSETHIESWGNAYSEIEFDRAGEVRALWPFHPSQVWPHVEDGELWYRVTEGASQRELPAERMLHLRGLSTRGLIGLSPLAAMRQAIGIAVRAESYGARFFANDARPSVVLKHPLTLEDKAKTNLRESWLDLHQGADRSSGLAILEEGMEIETISIPPADAQFLETRRFQVQEFARYYRIPPHMLADVDRSTSWGTGIEEQNIGFDTYTMNPRFTRAEQEMGMKLLTPDEREVYYPEFNREALLRGDAQSRAEFYAKLFQVGALNPNDIAERENLNPIPGGDQHFVPLNMVPVQDVSEDGAIDEEPIRRRRETRQALGRQRMANVHRVMFRDVAARLVRIETQEVRKLRRTTLVAGNVDAFRDAIQGYYSGRFLERANEHMFAPVRTLAEAISAEAADEVGGDPLPDEDLDFWTREYVRVYGFRHAGDSRSRLLRRINDFEADPDVRAETRQEDGELADILDAEIDAWSERPDEIAGDETHRAANGIAKKTFYFLGVMTLRWLAAGDDPCDYCLAMDGRKVSQDQSFLGAGTALSPGGIAPFISQSSIGHPPLHAGCQCMIVPG